MGNAGFIGNGQLNVSGLITSSYFANTGLAPSSNDIAVYNCWCNGAAGIGFINSSAGTISNVRISGGGSFSAQKTSNISLGRVTIDDGGITYQIMFLLMRLILSLPELLLV